MRPVRAPLHRSPFAYTCWNMLLSAHETGVLLNQLQFSWCGINVDANILLTNDITIKWKRLECDLVLVKSKSGWNAHRYHTYNGSFCSINTSLLLLTLVVIYHMLRIKRRGANFALALNKMHENIFSSCFFFCFLFRVLFCCCIVWNDLTITTIISTQLW